VSQLQRILEPAPEIWTGRYLEFLPDITPLTFKPDSLAHMANDWAAFLMPHVALARQLRDR
jgi:hypothetical protein